MSGGDHSPKSESEVQELRFDGPTLEDHSLPSLLSKIHAITEDALGEIPDLESLSEALRRVQSTTRQAIDAVNKITRHSSESTSEARESVEIETREKSSERSQFPELTSVLAVIQNSDLSKTTETVAAARRALSVLRRTARERLLDESDIEKEYRRELMDHLDRDAGFVSRLLAIARLDDRVSGLGQDLSLLKSQGLLFALLPLAKRLAHDQFVNAVEDAFSGMATSKFRDKWNR